MGSIVRGDVMPGSDVLVPTQPISTQDEDAKKAEAERLRQQKAQDK